MSEDPSPNMAIPEVFDGLSYAAEVKRKVLHLSALLVPILMTLLERTILLALFGLTAILAVSADALRVRSHGFARFIYRVFGFMMRDSERPPVGGHIVINGATWIILSALLLSIIFPLNIVAPSLIMFMLGDAAAALVGRRFGRTHWGSNPRTVEGSAAFLLVGLAVMAFFPEIPFWISAAGTVCACLVEILPGPFSDNIRVPLVAASVIYLLMWFFV